MAEDSVQMIGDIIQAAGCKDSDRPALRAVPYAPCAKPLARNP